MMASLTPKQEAFALAYIETGNASEAYRRAYNTGNMKPETVNRNAKALTDDNKISTRISELQAAHQQRHAITIDGLTTHLEDARALAMKNDQATGAVQAVMGTAKLHGMLKDKVEHSGEMNLSTSSEWTNIQAAILRALKPYPDAKAAVLDALDG
jgi:phage terminase small subunit